ncbi:hypothetical protein BJ912DRAFT_932918 [Pholiota molesta]|nr:hypothetical protein BJ912DRAFT_932918 [Pholiota molesta]
MTERTYPAISCRDHARLVGLIYRIIAGYRYSAPRIADAHIEVGSRTDYARAWGGWGAFGWVSFAVDRTRDLGGLERRGRGMGWRRSVVVGCGEAERRTQCSSTRSWAPVPEELRIRVLSLLDAVALGRCSMTCKSICETIKYSSLLAYTIQLHMNGLKDPRSSAPHADLLEHLLQYRQAWLSFELVEPVTLHLPHDGRTLNLVGAAFACTKIEQIAQIISLPTSHNLEKYTPQNIRQGLLLYDDENHPSQTDTRVVCVYIRTMSTSCESEHISEHRLSVNDLSANETLHRIHNAHAIALRLGLPLMPRHGRFQFYQVDNI